LSLLPRTTGGGGHSQEEILQEKAKDILGKIPEPFDMFLAARKHPIMYEESMNTVL
jgi:dynein heavy chain